MNIVSRSLALAVAAAVLGTAPAAYAKGKPQTTTTKIRDLAQEERNRKLVVDFYNGVFSKHDVEKSAQVLVDSYRQHNPGVPDGKAPFVSFFTSFFASHPEAHSQIVRTAADGDLVYLHVHATNGDPLLGRAIVDIFRVENNRIVEHWDVVQQIPEKAANNNTMF
jgi:predicted SnoaL-like aldol condensation-catalyzing enzyme